MTWRLKQIMTWQEKKDIYEYLLGIADVIGELKEMVEGIAASIDLDVGENE